MSWELSCPMLEWPELRGECLVEFPAFGALAGAGGSCEWNSSLEAGCIGIAGYVVWWRCLWWLWGPCQLPHHSNEKCFRHPSFLGYPGLLSVQLLLGRTDRRRRGWGGSGTEHTGFTPFPMCCDSPWARALQCDGEQLFAV